VTDKSQWQERRNSAGPESPGLSDQGVRATRGNCYATYGWDKDLRKVEIYFDPVSGKPVKTEIHD
jgi:hypothetical protein